MKDQLTETMVGLLVLAIAALFAVYVSSTIGQNRQSGAIDLVADFASVGSVASGADIRMAGVKIGTVTDISLNTSTYEARVTLNVRSDIPVPEDSVAKIVSDGLLGSAYISIEPGSEEEMMQADASFEYTQGAVDLLGLLGQFAGGNSSDKSSE